MENKPNIFVSPFAAPILKQLIRDWLEKPNGFNGSPKIKDVPFDENDSWAWAIKDVKEILEELKNV